VSARLRLVPWRLPLPGRWGLPGSNNSNSNNNSGTPRAVRPSRMRWIPQHRITIYSTSSRYNHRHSQHPHRWERKTSSRLSTSSIRVPFIIRVCTKEATAAAAITTPHNHKRTECRPFCRPKKPPAWKRQRPLSTIFTTTTIP